MITNSIPEVRIERRTDIERNPTLQSFSRYSLYTAKALGSQSWSVFLSLGYLHPHRRYVVNEVGGPSMTLYRSTNVRVQGGHSSDSAARHCWLKHAGGV